MVEDQQIVYSLTVPDIILIKMLISVSSGRSTGRQQFLTPSLIMG